MLKIRIFCHTAHTVKIRDTKQTHGFLENGDFSLGTTEQDLLKLFEWMVENPDAVRNFSLLHPKEAKTAIIY